MKQLNRRSVTIDADLWRCLKFGALTENLTTSEYVVRLLRRALASAEPPPVSLSVHLFRGEGLAMCGADVGDPCPDCIALEEAP